MTLNFYRLDFLARCRELVLERNDLAFERNRLDLLCLALNLETIYGVLLLPSSARWLVFCSLSFSTSISSSRADIANSARSRSLSA